MKLFILLASCFTFTVAQVTIADDGLPKSSATTQVVAGPTSSAHPTAVNANQSRTASQPNRNVRGGPQLFPQQTHLASLAMNVPSPSKSVQTRQVPDASPQRVVTSASGGSSQGANNNHRSYFDAIRRCRHERHDCNWWKQHFTTIVFVSTAYYYLDAGYWYPALGYDPANDYYDYDGPIYTYGNLLPDQVIANVQSALQREGYYFGPVTGSLAPATRAAIAKYQIDHGLILTGAIDQPTIESLGLT
jgi:Putative peptidoglycan binding domain